jgi:hypothetical protein
MLGDVGLALEAFRKAQRANPSDTAALAGIGDCYAAMGRFDLAQSNYETALALAPHDRNLLLGIAAIFESEGKMASAAAARVEAGIARQSAPAAEIAVRPTFAPLAAAQRQIDVPAPAIGSVTVELPAARPAEHLEARSAAFPEPQIPDDMNLKSTVTVQLPAVRPVSPRLPVPRDRDTATTAITVPYLRVQMSLHRAHREYNIIVGCRFNHPIADDLTLGINAIDLILFHGALTQPRLSVRGQPATYSYLWLKPLH